MAGEVARRSGLADLAGGVGLGAWAAFGLLAMCVVGRGASRLPGDEALLTWSVGHRPVVVVALARGLTATGTGVIPYGLVVLAGLIAGRTMRHRLVCAALGLGCLTAGQALRYGLMTLAGRQRPPRVDWRTQASGWSFPSGHTTTAALTAGILITALLVRAPRGRTPLAAAIGCWGALVGLTRIYLGVHWLTDVLGGWLLAVGWLGLCLCTAAWWLPDRLTTHPTKRASHTWEQHAPQDPDR
ncbi:phosphatase PAP2 family protein [Streptomyces sp. NPDC102467]|uniref:phosphatase PAP2 family protein n=1 Tax=Streptomyces sp. NPDC102467 TaxID=3366179 RepID=UPI0038073DC3